jgi:hypothetical protein
MLLKVIVSVVVGAAAGGAYAAWMASMKTG